MPLTFPRLLSDFFSQLKIVDCHFDLSENVNVARTASGGNIVTEYGTRRWYGSVTLKSLNNVPAESILAMVRVVMSARASFLLTPHHYKLPTSPGNAVVLNTYSNGYDMRLSGLPAAYALPRGAFLAILTAGGRRSFHQVAESVTADANGLTPLFTVEPAIKPFCQAGDTVEVATPRIKAKYVPQSYRPARIRSVITNGATFDWEEIP